MIKNRIGKLEKALRIKIKTSKLWDVKFGKCGDTRIIDIKAGKVEHPAGGFYFEKDLNFFLDFDMFMPRIEKEKYA